jgi:predicted Zn finger-like uncharacterized protein
LDYACSEANHGTILPDDYDVIHDDFSCPQCESHYRVIRAKAGPQTSDQSVHCMFCGHALAPRDGEYVLKYFLISRSRL